MRERARSQGVDLCLIPAVDKHNFDLVRKIAHSFKDLYALGIHPLYTLDAKEDDLDLLHKYLKELCTGSTHDERLVAVGEIGLDGFEKNLDWSRQIHFYEAQLKLALHFDLPVVLHVRQAVDFVLKALRKYRVRGGIAHAFNGSLQQAQQFIDMGFKLGFGGAVTYPRALHLRRLAQQVPVESIVLETDSPDIVPTWLYVNAQNRAQGQAQGRNEPAELPKIANEIAQLRGVSLQTLMQQSTLNFLDALGLDASIFKDKN
jgi:TatD DNase family protein